MALRFKRFQNAPTLVPAAVEIQEALIKLPLLSTEKIYTHELSSKYFGAQRTRSQIVAPNRFGIICYNFCCSPAWR
jgi:hypothetical protein